MWRISAKILLAALSLYLLGACSPVSVEYTDNKDVYVDTKIYKQEGAFLIVYATLRNNDSDDVNNSVYRVEWYNDDGLLLEKTSWRPAQVKGGAAVHVRERSTIPGATKANIVLSNDAR
ncbi:MAG: DUF1425 domain-containing protein [Deltaproteobacteria bacterium]|jgi:uncharacterized protein YcfL|nr:DUF1425 domain-containing protein [Deltaproteobacteria bacterium]